MKRLCSALLVLAMAGCSGVDVQGIVRDERTGEPLPGATVKIGDEETATDYRGFFELEVDEDEAPQQMHVDKSGYETYTESVTFEGMDEVIQDVELAPGQQQGELDRMPSGQEGLPEDESLRSRPDLNQGGSMQGEPQQGGTPPNGWTPPNGTAPPSGSGTTSPSGGGTLPPSGGGAPPR